MELHDAIIQVKKSVGRECPGSSDRRWLTTFVDCYSAAHNRVELLVLEGSPAKGYILIVHGLPTKVIGLNSAGKAVKTIVL